MRVLLSGIMKLLTIRSACSYGFLNKFRPPRLIPDQVYLLDPLTGRVKVAAADFDKPNGIALSEDGKTAFVYAKILATFRHSRSPPIFRTSTGAVNGALGIDQTEPATM